MASPTLVNQIAGGTTLNGVTSFTIPSTTAGNTLVLVVADINPSFPVASATISGNAFTVVAQSLVNAGAEIWAVADIPGGVTSVSIVLTDPFHDYHINCLEFSNMPSTLSVDGTNSQGSSGTSITGPSVTPTSGKPILVICALNLVFGTTITTGPTNSFTALGNDSTGPLSAFAYFTAGSASGSYSTNYGVSAFSDWDMVIAALDGIASSSGPLPFIPWCEFLSSTL